MLFSSLVDLRLHPRHLSRKYVNAVETKLQQQLLNTITRLDGEEDPYVVFTFELLPRKKFTKVKLLNLGTFVQCLH